MLEKFDMEKKQFLWAITGSIIALVLAVSAMKLFHDGRRHHRQEMENIQQNYRTVYNADQLVLKNHPEKALPIYLQLLDSINDLQEPELYSRVKNNEGTCYFKLSLEKRNQPQLKKSIDTYYQALKVIETANNGIFYAAIHKNLGDAYKELATYQDQDKESNIKQAKQHYRLAVEIYGQAKDKHRKNYDRLNRLIKELGD